MGWFDNITNVIKNTSASRDDPARVGGGSTPTAPTAPSSGIRDNLMDWASQHVPPQQPWEGGPPPTAPTGGGTQLTMQQIADQMRAKYPNGTVNAAAMDDLFNTLQANGFKVERVPHGSGTSADKFYVNGEMYDFASGADGGAGSFWPNWSPIQGEGRAGTPTAGTGSSYNPTTGETPYGAPASANGRINLAELGTGDLARPYGQTYTPPDWVTDLLNKPPAEYGETYKPPEWVTEYLNKPPEVFEGVYEPPDWTKLGPPEEWTEKFHAPTAEEVRQTPGYEFNLTQGLQGMDTGAAARGTLLTTGNQKERLKFATGLADTYYGEAYQRALGEYQDAYGIFRDNQKALENRARDERTLGRGEFETNRDTFYGNADLRRNAAQTAQNMGISGFNTNYGVWRDAQGNSYDAATAANNIGMGAFNTNYNVFRSDNNDIFGRYRDLSTLGMSGADKATS